MQHCVHRNLISDFSVLCRWLCSVGYPPVLSVYETAWHRWDSPVSGARRSVRSSAGIVGCRIPALQRDHYHGAVQGMNGSRVRNSFEFGWTGAGSMEFVHRWPEPTPLPHVVVRDNPNGSSLGIRPSTIYSQIE